MCQTTAPLTKKPSHLLWNAFSQWLPLDWASAEVKVWCLITFHLAEQSFAHHFEGERKCHLTFIVPRNPGGSCFSACRVFLGGGIIAKASGSSSRFDTSAAFLKVRSDTILWAQKWILEHHETLKLSCESHWKAVSRNNFQGKGDPSYTMGGRKMAFLLAF